MIRRGEGFQATKSRRRQINTISRLCKSEYALLKIQLQYCDMPAYVFSSHPIKRKIMKYLGIFDPSLTYWNTISVHPEYHPTWPKITPVVSVKKSITSVRMTSQLNNGQGYFNKRWHFHIGTQMLAYHRHQLLRYFLEGVV